LLLIHVFTLDIHVPLPLIQGYVLESYYVCSKA